MAFVDLRNANKYVGGGNIRMRGTPAGLQLNGQTVVDELNEPLRFSGDMWPETTTMTQSDWKYYEHMGRLGLMPPEPDRSAEIAAKAEARREMWRASSIKRRFNQLRDEAAKRGEPINSVEWVDQAMAQARGGTQ